MECPIGVYEALDCESVVYATSCHYLEAVVVSVSNVDDSVVGSDGGVEDGGGFAHFCFISVLDSTNFQ